MICVWKLDCANMEHLQQIKYDSILSAERVLKWLQRKTKSRKKTTQNKKFEP